MIDITIGQFFPGRSVFHRMDPRMKLVLTLGYIIAIFIPQNWVGLAVAIGLLILSAALSRLPAKLFLKGLKPVIVIVIFTSLLNVLYIRTGVELVSFGFVHIYSGGLITAAFLGLRIICLVLGSSLLTYTTTPTDLTDALERLLKPLKWIKVPVHELAMMMTIALRFIPTLVEETDKIMSAQKARGADMDSGGLIRRIKALLPVLVPLFVSSFRRAYELATAMECRCYRGGEGRTRMKQLHLAALDFTALAVFAAALAAIIALNFLLPPVW
ncbi:MAG: energy-coupling factor transporter transmembrane component T family protein [Acutalibacteraceae bacterium]|jgi:energy-coupling factor transport system permease protein